MRRATHRLILWPGVQADGNSPTSTPSKISTQSDLDRLEKFMRKYDRGDLQKVDWLDELAFKQLESIRNRFLKESDKKYLYIELPIFDFPIVFNEKEYLYPNQITLRELDANLITVFDSEVPQDNPVENKHRKLARSHRNGPLDRELKPNAKLRDEIIDILRYPPTKILSDLEKDLLWKFRFYLTRYKKAITKFLKCVLWHDPVESKQAAELLGLWVDIDVEDALELLGPSFTDSNVRSFAVAQLGSAADDELQLYLLQLVQALKFEKLDQKSGIFDSPLARFLIERGIANPILGNALHWNLMVECEDKVYGRTFGRVVYKFLETMLESPEGINRKDNLRRQGELVATLSDLSKRFRTSKEARPRKIEKLRSFIADPRNGLLSFPPLSLPLDPSIEITGLIPEKSSIFKSGLSPLFLTFTCLDGSEYPLIFKTGDDLRQDQLILQIFTLMDRLLQKENLNLRLTPYHVLATGIDHGMIQFIHSSAIASILKENSSLIPYMSPNQTEIKQEVLDNYIRSLAGYCIMTYLLGVGDRHLDNVLLTANGHLFHIDFGFILGRDPKPFPPPMKICKEMVEAMGGVNSKSYHQFLNFSFIAFNSLRKSANLILNLFSLMVNSNIPDISLEADKAVLKVLERYRLDLTDEEAIKYCETLINQSIAAYFPQIMEKLHQVAQFLYS
ncbi:kinase-like domain-containing protein [Globomyces pollinis-pini]|nr:kinase-like domain-containing protein [Globomyces pollinis-pini]